MSPSGHTDKTRILEAASHLYDEGGLRMVTMRGIARLVGVSPAAIYHYYPGRHEILLDVSRSALRRLVTALGTTGSTPAERLFQSGWSYADFALGNQTSYEIIFTRDLQAAGEKDAASDHETLTCIGQIFEARIRDCVDAGLLDCVRPASLALTLWANAHGLISIYGRGLLPVDILTFRKLYRQSGRRILDGVATPRFAAEMSRVAPGA